MGTGIPSQTAGQLENPKSEVPPAIFNSVIYVYICKCICASICIIKCFQVDPRGSMIVLLYYIISHCVKAVNTDCQTLMPWHVDKPLNNACV